MPNEAPAPNAPVGSESEASPVAPAAPAVAATPAPSTETQVDPTDQINSITDLGKLREILKESKNPDRKKPETKPKKEPEGGDQSRPTPLETAIVPEPKDDDEPELGEAGYDATRPVPKHLHVNTQGNEKAAAFIKAYRAALRENSNANPAQVAATIGFETPAAQPAPVETKPAQVAAPGPDPFQAQRDRITAIGEDIKKAVQVDYDNIKAIELAEERATLKAEIKEGEKALAAQAQQQVVFNAGVAEAVKKAHAISPESAVKGTVQYSLVMAEMAELERSNPALLDTNPNYPVVVLESVKKKFPDLFKASAAAAPAATPPATTQQPGAKPRTAAPPVRPVGQVMPGNQGGGDAKSTAASDIASITNMDTLRKLGGLIGTKLREKRVW